MVQSSKLLRSMMAQAPARAARAIPQKTLKWPQVPRMGQNISPNSGCFVNQQRQFGMSSSLVANMFASEPAPEPVKELTGFAPAEKLPQLEKFYNFAMQVDLFNDLHVPKVAVSNAGVWHQCNGNYRQVVGVQHNGRPLYRNPSGAVMYSDSGRWKMNMTGDTDGSVYFKSSVSDLPPDGEWKGDADGDICYVEAKCARTPGWSVLADSTSNLSGKGMRHATTFVILGNNKKGKTWIMSQLSSCELPFDSTMHTPGLCMKEIQLNGDPGVFRLIDSKGENTPLEEVTTERLKERTLEESFFREVTCQMADAFIYVVGDMGYDEQTTLNELSNLLSAGRYTANQIIVIHNLKHVRTQKGLDDKFEELQNIFCQQGFIVGREGNLRFLQKDRSGERMAAVHLVLGASETEADKINGESYNDLVFNKIRSIMQNLPKKQLPLDKTFGEELADVMTQKVPRYYQNAQDMKVEYSKDAKKMQLGHSHTWQDLRLLDVSLGNFIKIEVGTDTAYTISEDGDKRILRIHVSGCTPEMLAQNTDAVQFDDVEDGSVSVDVNLEPLRPVFEKEIIHKKPAPTQSTCTINIGKRTKEVTPDSMTLEHGVLTLVWDLRRRRPVPLK